MIPTAKSALMLATGVLVTLKLTEPELLLLMGSMVALLTVAGMAIPPMLEPLKESLMSFEDLESVAALQVINVVGVAFGMQVKKG